MKTALSILGWLVAVAMLIAAGSLYAKNQTLRSEMDQASNELARLEAEFDAERAALEVTETDAGKLIEPIADAVHDSTVTPATTETVETPESSEDRASAEPDGEESEQSQGDAMRRVQRAQLGVMVGMQYNSLLEDLALPEETLNAVNEMLIDATLEAQRVTVESMMSGTSTAKEAKAKQDAVEARLRDQLSEVLNEDEMAQWDTYQDFADEVLYESLLDGQLAMLAPGLSEETRQTAKIVLAEELAAELDRFFESDTIYTMDSFNDAQMVGLNQGMEKLPDTVSEEQYAQLTGFIDQVAAIFQQMKQ